MYEIMNLSIKNLRLIAKDRNINDPESMRKDKFLRLISNDKRDKKSLFK